MKRSAESIRKQKATLAAKRKQKKASKADTGLRMWDVKIAIIALRRIRARMVKRLNTGALAWPNDDHIDALDALRHLTGEES
ncbi:MAG TPA: hypothetical protein VFA39_15830 [Steroidobacteraceae bacterium]|nr:hypothetical protein [Steroidobacteraceae bacterium]